MTAIVLCLDGLDPAYLAATATPGWDSIAADGNSGTCTGVVPSLTNVNNVSIVTGEFPATHGITGNTYYDRDRDERIYMERPEFLTCQTHLETASDDATVAALVAKKKLQRMVGRGCDIAASAEAPPDWLERAVGPAPDIYSGEATPWLLSAAEFVIEESQPDILYVSTTDVVPHKHDPEAEVAKDWVREIDSRLTTLAGLSEALIATADHGMNHKSICIDLAEHLAQEGIESEVIRLIRDRHTYHHQNLGGAAYIYLHDTPAPDVAWLADIDGVDEVLLADEAATRFELAKERIGDVLVLGTPNAVFGPVEAAGETQTTVDLRSHGSHHERTVPFLANHDVALDYNLDAFGVLENLT